MAPPPPPNSHTGRITFLLPLFMLTILYLNACILYSVNICELKLLLVVVVVVVVVAVVAGCPLALLDKQARSLCLCAHGCLRGDV